MAKKGYYWIKQPDFTLNALQYYQASVVGDIKFDLKRGLVYARLDRYFPVGSVFHFTGNTKEYYITARERKPGLFYVIKRTDGCGITADDIQVFESGRYVHRTGYAHGTKP